MSSPPDPFSAFEAPRAELGEPVPEVAPAEAVRSASLGLRFVNFVVDYITYLLLLFVFTFGLVFVVDGSVSPMSEGAALVLGWAMISLQLVLWLTYYAGLEYFTGRTLGKVVTGTHVVRIGSSERPSLGQCIGRAFARVVPFEPLSFFFGSPLGWHDTWSGTMVVRDPD